MRGDTVLAPSGGGLVGTATSHKDLYHQEIRQLLEKLNADEAVFPYAISAGGTTTTSNEPIYATANKKNKKNARK